VTNGKWRNFPNDDARTGDNFLRRITLTHQPAEIIAGSERFAQTIECFCPERLEQFVRHQAHVLKHAGAMPADNGSIVRGGLADVKFLRHKRKSSVAATILASKDGSIRGGYFDRKYLFYWQGMVKEMRDLAERYRNVIAECGAAAQRAGFLKMIGLSMLMESRFRPSQKCVELAERAVAECEGANNLSEAGMLIFRWDCD